jgi:hypothetical protein
MINGIKCLIKYEIDSVNSECNVTVYSKIYAKELKYTFINIKRSFNPRSSIRRLNLEYGDSRVPYLSLMDTLEETYVDTQSDALYYMLPK